MNTMRVLSVFILFIFGYQILLAQENTDEIGQIPIYVDMPKSFDGIGLSHSSKLESRIKNLISRNGLSGDGYTKVFAIQPMFEIYDTKIVEGMQNITVVDAEIDLHIKNMINGVVYASYNRRITGSGNNKKAAINNAIRSIPTRDRKVSEFLDQAKKEILAYYDERCESIIAKADAAIQSQNYDQAIAILTQVPEEAGECYPKTLEKSTVAYKGWQDQNCSELIQKAKTNEAANNFSQSLHYLSKIDPSSKCSSESIAIIKSISKKVDTEERKEWNLMLKKYNDKISMQKSTMQNLKEISLAYINSQPKEAKEADTKISLFDF